MAGFLIQSFQLVIDNAIWLCAKVFLKLQFESLPTRVSRWMKSDVGE
ncbi:hypothetical protein JCM19240_857 [Vibrio maritimus]|uniref:Uncharacterized protein n=1 Tax=Vibrio maritimus TaxID=990268 RepID=A0A090T5D1_9VIBR|nr:hypothetical protein JCM19240_857 [Vibrio maritimus]